MGEVIGQRIWPSPITGHIGRGDWIRTSDPLLPKQMRYQAAPLPVTKCQRGGIIYGMMRAVCRGIANPVGKAQFRASQA